MLPKSYVAHNWVPACFGEFFGPLRQKTSPISAGSLVATYEVIGVVSNAKLSTVADSGAALAEASQGGPQQQRRTMNAKLQTPNPEPSTLNPKPKPKTAWYCWGSKRWPTTSTQNSYTSGLGGLGFGLRVWGVGFRLCGLGFRVSSSGFGV